MSANSHWGYPVHGPSARPNLEVEALHEPRGRARHSRLSQNCSSPAKRDESALISCEFSGKLSRLTSAATPKGVLRQTHSVHPPQYCYGGGCAPQFGHRETARRGLTRPTQPGSWSQCLRKIERRLSMNRRSGVQIFSISNLQLRCSRRGNEAPFFRNSQPSTNLEP